MLRSIFPSTLRNEGCCCPTRIPFFLVLQCTLSAFQYAANACFHPLPTGFLWLSKPTVLAHMVSYQASNELTPLGAAFFQRLTRVGILPPHPRGITTLTPQLSPVGVSSKVHMLTSPEHTFCWLLSPPCFTFIHSYWFFLYFSDKVLTLKFLSQGHLLGKFKDIPLLQKGILRLGKIRMQA